MLSNCTSVPCAKAQTLCLNLFPLQDQQKNTAFTTFSCTVIFLIAFIGNLSTVEKDIKRKMFQWDWRG